ncbi:hypothetical protein D3C73_1409490 [compost metagenome]
MITTEPVYSRPLFNTFSETSLDAFVPTILLVPSFIFVAILTSLEKIVTGTEIALYRESTISVSLFIT